MTFTSSKISHRVQYRTSKTASWKNSYKYERRIDARTKRDALRLKYGHDNAKVVRIVEVC